MKKFIPLEANPDVLTRFAGKLGLNTKKLQFCDVFGLDEVVYLIHNCIHRMCNQHARNFELLTCKVASILREVFSSRC